MESDLNIEIIEKSPSDAKRWKRTSSFIKKHNFSVCENIVAESYITETIDHMDAIIIAYKYYGQRLAGFVFLKKFVDGVYIDVICAKGVGTLLMDEVWKYALFNNMRYNTLSALPHVINYYRRFGFKNTALGCAADSDIEQFAKRVETFKFKEQIEAINNEQFSEFLHALINRGLVKDKNCKGISVEEPGCSVNGYSMTLCVNNYSRASIVLAQTSSLINKPSPSRRSSRISQKKISPPVKKRSKRYSSSFQEEESSRIGPMRTRTSRSESNIAPVSRPTSSRRRITKRSPSPTLIKRTPSPQKKISPKRTPSPQKKISPIETLLSPTSSRRNFYEYNTECNIM